MVCFEENKNIGLLKLTQTYNILLIYIYIYIYRSTFSLLFCPQFYTHNTPSQAGELYHTILACYIINPNESYIKFWQTYQQFGLL